MPPTILYLAMAQRSWEQLLTSASEVNVCFGSDPEDPSMSAARPPYPAHRTTLMRVPTSEMGHKQTIVVDRKTCLRTIEQLRILSAGW